MSTARTLVLLTATCAGLLATRQAHAGDAQNLLYVNPGFEDMLGFSQQHGVSQDLTGWIAENSGFNINQTIKALDAPDGQYVFKMITGGRLETAAEYRATARPGHTYELTFYSKKIRSQLPELGLGVQFWIIFYDANGKVVGKFAGVQAQKGDKTEWEKVQMQATAPEGSERAGIKILVNQGVYPNNNLVDFEFDNFALTEVAEAKATGK